jgi:AcrR family transcriptional regulator
MRRERQRRAPRAQTREALLDAAARVFARRGFHAASVEEVSEEAGLSTGALYSNFKGKDELFLRLYEERIHRRGRELREVVERSGGPEAGLGPAAANFLDVLRQEREWFLLYFEFWLHAARDPAFGERFRALHEAGLQELAEGIAEGLDQFGLEPPLSPVELGQAVRALGYGIALERVLDEASVADAQLGQVLTLLLRGLQAHSEDRG